MTTEIVPGQWNWAAGVAVQSTGSIVVVGNTYVPNSPQNIGLVRYTTEGALDPSFSADGKVVTNLGGIDQGLAVAVQANDKIVVAGQKCNNAGTTCDVAVLRYNSNGTLDKTFSGDGKQIDDFGGADNGSTGGLALQPNGKIIVGGYMFDKAAGNYDFAVYRYTGAGVLDPTFSKDGRVNIGFGTGRQDSVYEVAIQPDGKIVAVGESCDANYENCDFALARLNLNGTLDKTFSGDGKQTLNFGADDSALG